MIKLRTLREKDAPLMLEWMHDMETQEKFQKSMIDMNLQDAVNFCNNSQNADTIKNGDSRHFAITDDKDEYLGTISLKNIDLENGTAEYAISIRRKAQGRGIAKAATHLLLKKAFEEFELHKIYLNVLADNEKAIRFYEKYGFVYEGEARECLIKSGRYRNLCWYGMLRDEFVKLCGGEERVR